MQGRRLHPGLPPETGRADRRLATSAKSTLRYSTQARGSQALTTGSGIASPSAVLCSSATNGLTFTAAASSSSSSRNTVKGCKAGNSRSLSEGKRE